MKYRYIFIALIFLFTSCQKERVVGVTSNKAMVVSARVEASKIGLEILQKGGNAFDAMVATELALAVAYPYSGNLGGGGFMVYRKNDGAIGALDYREKAPLTATTDMFLDDNGDVIKGKSTKTPLSVGVPGTIAGIFEVYNKFGTLPFKDIIQPSIDLAKRGVIVTQKQDERIKKYKPSFLEANRDSTLFHQLWNEGDTIKYQALAETLTRIRDNGRDEFYKGKTAELFVDYMQRNGGIITLKDLAAYEAKWRDPVTFTYDDLKVISMAPPSSGGVCLAQIMNAIEPFDLHTYQPNSTKAMQVMVEAERRAYADRSYFLGDPDFVSIPMKELIDKEYAKERMASFSFEKATSSKDINPGTIEVVESDETTHYSIVDQFGNAVSVTTTLNGAYGSKIYIQELGFFLNNEMDDFSSKPGVPNMFGLIGAEANKIEPEKRMLSSMTPTIVEKNGKLWMIVGTPGGSTIITSVLQVILNVHEFGMGMQESVNHPRFHHQWLPDEIRIEPNQFDENTLKELEALGYRFNTKRTPIIGKVDAILVLPDGRYEGGADYRGDDTAVGF